MWNWSRKGNDCFSGEDADMANVCAFVLEATFV